MQWSGPASGQSCGPGPNGGRGEVKRFWPGRVRVGCDGAGPAAALGRVDSMVAGPGRSPARADTVWQRWRTTRDRRGIFVHVARVGAPLLSSGNKARAGGKRDADWQSQKWGRIANINARLTYRRYCIGQSAENVLLSL